MTRKRFWRLRNAMIVKTREWANERGMGYSGTRDKATRPVSGKPLVNFGTEYLPETSYAEVWNSEAMRTLRKVIGMEG